MQRMDTNRIPKQAFLLLQLYKSLWVLACSIISFHPFLSWTFYFQFSTPMLPRSFLTLNNHYNIKQKTKTYRTTEEEMEGQISFWGYKEQESNRILPEHDDDDDDFLIWSMSWLLWCVVSGSKYKHWDSSCECTWELKSGASVWRETVQQRRSGRLHKLYT